MARPKGSKNRRTILREAEEGMGRPEEFVDCMHVLEYTMRQFYARVLMLKQINGKQGEIDADLKEAAAIAEKIAPYRHPRLKAITLAGDPNDPVRFNDRTTAAELREEIMRDLAVLVDGGYLDLAALPAPKSE